MLPSGNLPINATAGCGKRPLISEINEDNESKNSTCTGSIDNYHDRARSSDQTKVSPTGRKMQDPAVIRYSNNKSLRLEYNRGHDSSGPHQTTPEKYLQSRHHHLQHHHQHQQQQLYTAPHYVDVGSKLQSDIQAFNKTSTDQSRSDLKKPNQISEKQEASEQSFENVVETVLDLPVFVTIEGYRIASYFIVGEPYLCLPQLLQFLKQSFPLETIVDTFGEADADINVATPKQVDGLIKAGVMQSGAKSCPLIKRSDADKICLKLYEGLMMRRGADKNPRSSRNMPLQLTTTDNTSKNILDVTDLHTQGASESSIDTKAYTKPQNLTVKSTTSTTTTDEDRSNRHSGTSSSTDSPTKDPRTQLQSTAPSTKDYTHIPAPLTKPGSSKDLYPITTSTTPSCSSATSVIQKNHPTTSAAAAAAAQVAILQHQNQTDLFEGGEAQSSILDLAKAVSSTLIIQVYHRCFGKGSGLFYPALLIDSESECIECSRCYRMMSPRRFIGHTHHTKEIHVCHWGFNSYNWRHYIKLSTKQLANNLDGDELLIQFSTLQSAPDSEKDKSASNSYPYPALSSSLNYTQQAQRSSSGPTNDAVSTSSIFPWHFFSALSQQTTQSILSHQQQAAALCSSHIPLTSLVESTTRTKANRSLAPHQAALTSSSSSSTSRYNIDTGSASATGVGASSSINPTSGGSSSSSSGGAMGDIPCTPYSIPTIIPAAMTGGSGGGAGGETLSYADPILRYGLDIVGGPRHHAFNIELQREIYVSNNLGAYLNAVGLNGEMISNITQATLAIVRKSRLLS